MSIWVGRYAIVAGEVREHGPWLVERGHRREDDDLRLFVLADPVDERSAEFCAEVAEAVAELFSRETLSITGGLLRALGQAHSNLAEWNRRSLREHQVAVGLTCIAIRDGDATIAQAGPGVVYISGPEGVRRLAAEDAAARPLGGTEPVEPQFFSTRLDEDRMLLLLTGSVDQLIGSSAIGVALAAGPERTLTELYRRTRGVSDMTAVLIADIEFDEDDLDDLDGPPAPAVADFEAAAEAEPAEDRDEDEAPEPGPAGRPLLAPVRPEPDLPSPVDSGVRRNPGSTPGSKRRLPALRRQTTPFPAPGRQPGSLSRVGVRMRSMRQARGRLRGYALIGVVLLAAVVLAVCTLPSLLEEDRGAQLDDAIVAAREHIAAAAATDDPAAIRTELRAALTEISRGRSISADDVRLAGLQTQAEQGLARLDAVVDLGAAGLRRVLAFDGAITAPFAPSAIASGGDALWLVDSQRGRVFRVATDGQQAPAEVYRVDSTYGGIVAGGPSAVTWDAEGGRLLILDSARHLFELTPGEQPIPLPVRGIGELKSAAAIASYDGNLYVLDPAGGEIWRYLPGGDGFDSERTNTLGGIDIADSRSLAVDGEFYLLGAAGVRHFRQDRELPPLFKGVDRPLSSPAALAVDPSRRLTYVADRGGRRVVVSDGDGNYQKQYRHPQFFDLRGIALAPDGATVYALTGDGIYAFTPAP